MSTKPVNSQGMQNPLLAPKGADAGKAKGAVVGDVKLPLPVAGGANAASAKGDGKGSNVQISADAKDRAEAMQKAFDIAKNTPDVRETRVAELKKQIQDGSYQLDSGKIADGMLREAVREHLADADER